MGVSTPALPSVEYDDINPGMGTLNKEPKSKVTSKRGIHFNPGDVLFGKLRPYLKNWLFACFEGVAVGDFWVLTSSKIDHGFTYSLIQAPEFQYIANLSSGSKMPRSDWGLVSNARTFIPTNLSEQKSISSVLFGLDTAITLHEEKRLQLERFKRALLQRMFAYKIRYPKLRFNRFSDKWITINLGNILIQSIQKNKGYSYPVFTSSRQGLVRQIEHFGSNQQHDTADYNVIFPNQITYRNRSDDGQFTFNVNKLGSVGLVSKFYPVFVLKDFDNDFVVNDLNNNAKVKYDLSVLSVGTGQHVLSFANLCKYSIIAPDNHEQQKIGQLFSHLDVSLALCDMKIKRLKKLKHGLLQKMFV